MTDWQLDGDAMTEPTSGIGSDGRRVTRRHLLGVGAGLGTTLVAGCTGSDGDSSSEGGDGGTTDGSTTEATAGTFRLLISDQPVAIDEFDSLDVSFDRARIFPAGEEDGEEAETETDDAETNETTDAPETNETDDIQDPPAMNGSEGDDAEAAGMNESVDEDSEESDDDGEAGFSTIDLDGATVDLTQVVGDKAIGVFEGELSAGRYAKIELYASGVEGIVDGETADVKIPSGKLQIVKPFEITPGEPVSFVFDINVVRKGTNGYNLLPVISESGVAGKDVEVEEIDADDGGSNGDEAAAGNETETDDPGSEETADSPTGSEPNGTAGNSTAENEQ